MIGQATAHRRANAFAQALETLEGTAATEDVQQDTAAAGRQQGGSAGHGSHAAARHADPDQSALLALATTLARQPRPALDPERKTVQRAQLIAAMEQALADGSFPVTARVPEQRGDGQGGSHRLRRLTPTSRLSRRLAVGGLTVGVAAGAFGGVAAASTNALPGDSLYGLKRGMEDLKLDMASGDASRGKVYLDMASTRLQEARRLMDRGRGGQLDDESVSEVRRALSGMHQEAAEGHRLLSQAYQEDGSLQPIETLNSFAATHRQGWSDLRGKLPSQLTDVSDQVSSVFDAIDQEVGPLQGLLPQPKKGEHASGGSGAKDSGPGGDTPASPSTPASATPGQGSTGTQSATPSPSGSTPGDGLIGGANPLAPLPPPSPTPESPLPSTPSDHSVTLPPLLPGLLPGLGLGTTTDDEG
ncbi:DUF5667 domain-containing protein [Streptomyces sp. NBC_01198]|uniref:DUF5667 domain-containing protein n=1 Tax=Streptomyces sp. NBC_01198 TaxID=2903769 RepID=UPI002E11CAC9|nr:DUF5667 domain-containing protein [Streptomyces sp. NBC_01198]